MRADHEWAELTRDLKARVAAYAPEWTDAPSGDPGITLLQLFAFVAEGVAYRGDLGAADRSHVQHLLSRLHRAVESPCDDATLSRPNFYAGKLLGADDFVQEQAYQQAHRRRHNRLLHGVGVVHGLEVGLDPGSEGAAPSIVVSPGVALSPLGDELVVCDPVRVDPCSGTAPCYVTVAVLERPAGQTPDGNHERIEETAAVTTGAAMDPAGVTIARVVREASDDWRLDPTFRPGRVG